MILPIFLPSSSGVECEMDTTNEVKKLYTHIPWELLQWHPKGLHSIM
jgi:hypothetical protein